MAFQAQRRRLKAAQRSILEGMTDAELEALAAPIDLEGCTDAELEDLINDTASPELLARVERSPITSRSPR